MRERANHQASGLAALARARSARLVAMVSHGHEASELPMLWRLCLTWVELGYPVTVLDAGTQESENNPGLEQLLNCPHTALARDQDSTVWDVVPAASGLQTLCYSHLPLDHRLAGLFPDDGVVLVYGSAGVLARLLADQHLQPLMVVSPARESLLTSYQALKRLMSRPGLSPLVIDQSAENPTNVGRQTSAAETLAECARNFLSLELPVVHVQTQQGDAATADIQRLALRVLENALPLREHWTPHASTGAKMDARQFSRNH
jgi:hypothetical protein